MQKLKSFFELDVGLAEIELPAEYRSHFIRWSKKLEKQDKYSEKLKASIEIKNNEYYLILEEEDQKQYRMNISDLQKPAQKSNLLIQAPPYIDANDLNKTISLIQYKATAKFENNQRDLDDLSRKMKNLNKRKSSNSSSRDSLEVSENASEFDLPDPLRLAHQDLINPQKQSNMNQQNFECDPQQLRVQLIEFLRSKGEVGCTMQEIKRCSKFQDIADKQIQEVLKQISTQQRRQSKVYFSLNKTLF